MKYSFALLALSALATGACTAETIPGDGPAEDDVVAAGSCTGTAKTTANKAWGDAAALAKALPTSSASPTSKVDAIAVKLVQAVDACSGFEKLISDRSYHSTNATAIRASGGALAYAVKRAASADECTDPAPIANAAYATTSLNASYKAVVKDSPWAKGIRSMFATNYVLAELNGTSQSGAAALPPPFTAKDAFGNLQMVRFTAPRPGVFPVMDVSLSANGTFSLTQTGTGGDVEEVSGTWATSADGTLTLKAPSLNTAATVRRVLTSGFAPTYEFKVGSTIAFSFDADICGT